MKDRLMRVAFAGAFAVHVGLIAAGGALSPYLGRSGDSDPLRTIQVGLETPEPPPATQLPNHPDIPLPSHPLTQSSNPPLVPSASHPLPLSSLPPGSPTRVAQAVPAPATEAGGALNLGSASEHGDIEGLPSGRTPVGWVPGPDMGKGAGSGVGEGVGHAEPLPRTDPVPPPAPIATPPAPEPRPAAPPPPPPRRVSVRVCAASRLRPNPHCPESVTIEVAEGSEPHAVCSLHKAPPPPPPAPARTDPPPPTPAPAREEPLIAARLVHSTKPEYPASALEGNSEGSVSLRVEVRADGTCGDVEVARSSGSRILDAAAMRAVKRWRWEPAKRGGEAVQSTTRCRVRFELEE